METEIYKNLSLEDLPNEEWKTIPNYPKYLASNMGRIKSIKTNKILRQIENKKGYLSVSLYNEYGRSIIFVHRIVLDTFTELDKDKPFTDHINGNRKDNRKFNLRRCTQRENMMFPICRINRQKSMQEKHGKCVIGLSKENGRMVEFPSINSASRELFINKNAISKCCRGERKSAGGFIWEYKYKQ